MEICLYGWISNEELKIGFKEDKEPKNRHYYEDLMEEKMVQTVVRHSIKGLIYSYITPNYVLLSNLVFAMRSSSQEGS